MNRWHSLPAEVSLLVEQTPAAVLLECARPESRDSCSRLFIAPRRICAVRDSAELPALFAEIENATSAGYYAAGYFAYECGAFFEPSVARASRRSQPPPSPLLAWFGIYEYCFLFDHRAGNFVGPQPPGFGEFSATASEAPSGFEVQASLALNEQQYAERIAQIHELIRAGDIYQLNFTVPINIHATGSKAALYRALSQRQPVALGAYLHTEPAQHILSFSPELFFDLGEGGAARRILTRPMKGTAPRGRTTQEDREIAAWLANDEKNRAENLMIVDLLRNDLGRLCEFGSVRVDNLFSTERYQTLWQMTSAVSGELRPDVSYQQIFRALFPCGSITGAPKVRAMQLIADLEENPRGVATGAIGFFSRQRTIFNVAIRTIALDADAGSMGVGSGIVIDSNAADEYRECLLKAEFLLKPFASSEQQAHEKFSLIETLLWRNGYPLIELHLDRLEDSAAYFDFSCDRAAVKSALLLLAGEFAEEQPRKVRLLLHSNGGLHLEHEPLIASQSPGRVSIATTRTDPRDRMLFHKTTHRRLYANAYQEATQAGFDDALFLNDRDEVTEGAISNLFIEQDGRWFTPPIASGVLPGVYRRHLLETRPDIAERVLSLDDLRQADAIYLSNAVRGLRKVTINWELVDLSAHS
jgi:para-aminobenzoate synthetase/4-amino-4-deoxychorismate lyase